MRVIVVGAGLAGVATAVGLARTGHEVTLLERADEARESGTGVAVMPNGVLALDAIGGSEFVRAQASASLMGGMRDRLGRPLLVIDVARADRILRQLGAPGLVISRPELHRALRALMPDGVLRTSTEALRLDQADQHVTVHTSAATFTADAVIVADGIWSKLRTDLFPRHPGVKRVGRLALRGMTRVPAELPVDDLVNSIFVDRRTGMLFGCHPLVDRQLYWFTDSRLDGTAPPSAARARETQLAQTGDWHPLVPAVIGATPPDQIRVDVTAMLAQPLRTFVRGRIAMAGDAAHAMTPDLGQGANHAFEDAAVLARVLDGAGPSEVADQFRRYDDVRRPRANRALVSSARTSRMVRQTGLLGRVRDAAMRAIPPGLAAGAIAATMRTDGLGHR